MVVNELNVRGGTHKQLLRLCEYLSKNNDITIYTTIYEKEKTYPDFEKFNIVTPKLKNVKTNSKIKKVIYKIENAKKENKVLENLLKDIDIVNIHDSNVARLIDVSKKNNKKVVLQINDMPYYFLEGNAKGQKDNLKKKLIDFKT